MIEVRDLAKRYGATRAVDGISFDVRRGEVVGFLGPNGAGKTTTMKILTCYMAPTEGTARVAGFDVLDRSIDVRRRIGYLPEDTPLYQDMVALDYLRFITAIRDLPRAHRAARIREIADLCGVTEVLGKTVAELSRGYRQRLGLAQAMIHDPDILILDEPTSGLDPNQIVEIRELIKRIGREKTVILSTHILPEVQATCSRVLIIHEGKLVADGTPAELQRGGRGDSYHLVVEGAPADAAGAALRGVEGVIGVETRATDGVVDVDVTGRGDLDLRRPLFRLAVDRGWTLLELRRHQASLEDVFRRLTRE